MTQPAVDDRIMAALRSLIREEFPRLKFFGIYEYTIKSVSGSAPDVKISASPTDASIGLPDLVDITEQPSISGITSLPQSGLTCVVGFLNADPTRPVILGVESLGVNPVARLGDQVTVFLPPTLAVQGVGAVGPFAGTITVFNPVTGVISQGSGQVFTG